MASSARMVTTLKHGRGKVHELNCGWLFGKNAHPDLSKYHDVRASEVKGKAHCSHC